MEIGSFIELQFPCGKEYYSDKKFCGMDVVRLNSGRCAIYHACTVLECDTAWLPFYQCETVRSFLLKKGIKVKYYHIDKDFNPIDINQGPCECVVLVNYFGIMSKTRMTLLANNYKNVIIDNSQAFFAEPIEECINVYSARKFVGVPDGAYVIGDDATKCSKSYEQGYSSDTASFMLSRIEYGCEGKTYKMRTENEERIDREDVRLMSKLTHTILDGTDYGSIIQKRKENFEFVKSELECINKLSVDAYLSDDCVPMVYPLVVEDECLLSFLIANKHFQGRWWKYVLGEVSPACFEYYLSRYMIPITIDQRYGKAELLELCEKINFYVRNGNL